MAGITQEAVEHDEMLVLATAMLTRTFALHLLIDHDMTPHEVARRLNLTTTQLMEYIK